MYTPPPPPSQHLTHHYFIMPQTKRARTSYKQGRKTMDSKGINVMRSSPYNQMSRYMSRNNPFPAVEYATLRYVQRVTVSPGINGVAGFHTFRATSIFDPDFSGLTNGGQPYGHDTYSTIYNHYKVLGATCSIQGLVSNNNDFCGYGINVDDNNLFNTDPRWLMASKGSTYTLAAQNNAPLVLTRSYNHKMITDQSALCADFGANPSQEFFFRVFTITDQTSRDVDFVVTINYRVQMWGMKELSVT